MVSQGRGYDFDVCARLENSTITPSLIFLKFFPKISKSDDCTWVFYCLTEQATKQYGYAVVNKLQFITIIITQYIASF